MNLEIFHKEHFTKISSLDGMDCEDAYILEGCKQLHRATGAQEYKEFILQYAEKNMTEENLQEFFSKGRIDNVHLGRILFFLYDVTGEERFLKAIEAGKKQIIMQPRTDDKLFRVNEAGEAFDGKSMYKVFPYYMEYETVFHKKAEYNDIVSQLKSGIIGRKTYNNIEWYLMTLIDVIDCMSLEIYEHYKSLEEIFKATIKQVLQSELKLQCSLEEKKADQEVIRQAMLGYAILKACNIGVLNAEKYSEIGLAFMDGAIDNPCTMDDKFAMGICMMAQAQSILLKKKYI